MTRGEDMIDDFLGGIPQPKPYSELQREIHAEQDQMSREQVTQKMKAESESVFDPETAMAEEHHWVDRGLVMSCEGAAHPNHRHFKVSRR